MFLRIMALLFGIGFLFAGVAGFMPQFTPNNLLFGYFGVSPIHNAIHLASGVVALIAATDFRYAKWYFILFGLVYGAVAIVGVAQPQMMSMGTMMNMNPADNMLHGGIAIVSLLLGLTARRPGN